MNLSVRIKEEIVHALDTLLDGKLQDIRRAIEEIMESRDSDSKSSAGDKYESSREMMQIEIGKYQDQLDKYNKLKEAISQIDPGKQHSVIGFGSLVKTNQGVYFISVGLGPVQVNDAKYFAISLVSPIGQLLNGRKQGDSFNFQNKRIDIQEIQ